MGQRKNWQIFIECSKLKSAAHMAQAQKWDNVNMTLGLVLIVLASVTTILVLLKVPTVVSALVSGCSTLLSAIVAYMKPKTKREQYLSSAKDFKVLLLRMVRCESDKEYERLWGEYNKCLLHEPFLPKSHVKKLPVMEFSTTNELMALIHDKDEILDDMELRMEKMEQKNKEKMEKEHDKEEEKKLLKEKRKEKARIEDEKRQHEREERIKKQKDQLKEEEEKEKEMEKKSEEEKKENEKDEKDTKSEEEKKESEKDEKSEDEEKEKEKDEKSAEEKKED